MDFDYQKYSLEQLQTWMHDVVDGDVPVDEVYECISDVVKQTYQHHKDRASRAHNLLTLLNGYRQGSPGICSLTGPDSDEPIVSQKKWIVPVEEVMDEDTYEINYAITFPQDLLDQAGWMEGDQLEWIDRDDGSFQLRKVNDD
jgi:hypothetical protein